MNKIAYKGFSMDSNNNLKCRDFMFEVGKEYSIDGKLELCSNGFHFCWELNNVYDFYNFNNNIVCEVEIIGDIINDTNMKKSCTNKLKILRVLIKEEVLKLSNSGNRNSGDWNSGDWNSGDWNSGDWNSGNRNSGNRNSGNRNSGNSNSGNSNSGNSNSGDSNSGDWNSGDWNSGFFNTIKNNVYIFNQLSNMSVIDFRNSKYYEALTEYYPVLTEWFYYTEEEYNNDSAKKLIGGYLKKYDYKEAHKIWWDRLSDKSKKIITEIPNFDKNIFEEITGIKIV